MDKPAYTGAYGLLDTENPATARPTAVSKPVADEGPHLSYAFQWILFGVMAFVGLGWAVRQEYRIRNADDPEEQARAEVRRQKAAAKPRSDAEVEDELLDARQEMRANAAACTSHSRVRLPPLHGRAIAARCLGTGKRGPRGGGAPA